MIDQNPNPDQLTIGLAQIAPVWLERDGHAAQDAWDGGAGCPPGPDGEWLIEPLAGEEALRLATIDHRRVRQERQNLDPAGHYSRPDVTQLSVNRQRQSMIRLQD